MVGPAPLRTVRPAGEDVSRRPNATWRTVQWLGVLAAIMGVEHGIGEVTQGWQRLPEPMFTAWGDAEAFHLVGGEPALSVLPSYTVSGLASIAVACALGVWCTTQLHRRRAGEEIILLSVVLLVVGGGFGPPVIGVLVGAFATRIGAATPGTWSGPERIASLRLWRWALAAAVAGFLALVPGLVLLALVVRTGSPSIVLAVTSFAFAATAAAMTAARAHDRHG